MQRYLKTRSKKGNDEWLLAYVEATGARIDDAVDEYEKYSRYVGFYKRELEVLDEEDREKAEKTEYGYIIVL